jgi:hypothetical protein
MATNQYFSQQVKSEQFLYEDIIIESLKIYGQDVYYLPRTLVNEDKIFGEDVPSNFSSAYKIEMYIQNTEGFDGEGDLFSKFGIQIRDQATFIVARRRWAHTIGQVDNEINDERPREGDLIYLGLSKSLFQIMHVEHEQPFYQISNLATFKLRCELFEYNDEDLDTGILDIDAIEEGSYKVILNLNSAFDSSVPDFEKGNVIYQEQASGTVMRGEVENYNRGNNELSLVHIGSDSGEYGVFKTGLVYNPAGLDLFGNVIPNDISRLVLSVNEYLASDSSYAQNDIFDAGENDLLDFLDFSETNPFGDPGDTI